MTFERNDGIWISEINRDRIPQLCSRYWDSFLSHCCSSIIYMYTAEPFLVIPCFGGRSESFSYLNLMQQTDFYTWRMPHLAARCYLSLIHFKSRNSGVTWSRFKYFPLLATFAAKLIHFCISYCRFSLHLPHIEQQWFKWETIRAFIVSILDFWSRVFLTLFRYDIEFHLTGSTMIWCDAQKKDNCRISLPDFWLYLPYALLYRQLLFETSLSFCWNLVLQKECI